ncbi:hypothetical protein [uncultured Sphaerotilus sp.]|uniref:hypothetical protein n=1 Tax=uncultured Sphaerotilus sp. TaxID=474984 RepID=UPI0030CA2E73
MSARKTPAPVKANVKAKATPGADELPVAQGWQDLLERGLRHKTALLQSPEFKTTAQASELLGIGEPAVRKRIREGKLFALQTPGDGSHRIPAWALDPAIAGSVTLTLLSLAGGGDAWLLYHALTTPNGHLHGLRPFECLLSRQNLPPSQRAAREELAVHLQLSAKDALLEVVGRAVQAELGDAAATA